MTALSHMTGTLNHMTSGIMTALSHMTGGIMTALSHMTSGIMTALSHMTGTLSHMTGGMTALSHMTGGMTALSHMTSVECLHAWWYLDRKLLSKTVDLGHRKNMSLPSNVSNTTGQEWLMNVEKSTHCQHKHTHTPTCTLPQAKNNYMKLS